MQVFDLFKGHFRKMSNRLKSVHHHGPGNRRIKTEYQPACRDNRYSISMAVNDTGGTTREWAFNADGTANGSGAWTTGSDERHKFDLAEVSGALEKIAALRCVTYSKWDSEVRHVGLIAQDVGAICPEAISISTEPVRFSGNREIDDFQFLDISGFTAAYAFQAIKELHEMVNKQAAEIEEIKGLINSH